VKGAERAMSGTTRSKLTVAHFFFPHPSIRKRGEKEREREESGGSEACVAIRSLLFYEGKEKRGRKEGGGVYNTPPPLSAPTFSRRSAFA